MAKKILPWFGGSAAVWSTCLVFYQVTLLIGYVYAHLLTRYFPSRAQQFMHIAIVSISLILLPIGPSERWRPTATRDPTWSILEMLIGTIGLPFAVLSATSPLLQDWLARQGNRIPYRYFALSNFASLAALLSYPVLIEPAFDLRVQSLSWSVLYATFACLCATVAWHSRTNSLSDPQRGDSDQNCSFTQKAYWLGLSACGSMLLLSVTNHISRNVAPVPLVWVLPLAVYLLSFILVFRGPGAYKRVIWLRWLMAALLALGYAVHSIYFLELLLLPIFLLGLFVTCMFCHGELKRLRPEAQYLTGFYLMLSLGGATGAILVGLVAPRVFSGIYELPVSLVFTATLATILTWPKGAWSVRLTWIALTILMLIVLRANINAYGENALSIQRSFYGSLRVVQPPNDGKAPYRAVYHGTIEHGLQFLQSPLRSHPTTYYGPESGIGILLKHCCARSKRVGLVGLGAGTIAAYGESGDVFRFYEINPQMVRIAQTYFSYLEDSRASVSIIEGDGRLSIEREKELPYDVLVLDAFSGDAIPVHLLTRQAVALYLRHLKPGGVLAFHLTNAYLDLPPVVRQLAEEAGYKAVLLTNKDKREEFVFGSSWVFVTRNRTILENPIVKAHQQPIAVRGGLHPWTDGYNSLFQLLKRPKH